MLPVLSLLRPAGLELAYLTSQQSADTRPALAALAVWTLATTATAVWQADPLRSCGGV